MAKRIKNTIAHFSTKKCPDELLGTVIVSNSGAQWGCLIQKTVSKKRGFVSQKASVASSVKSQTHKIIVLVLESPHISEFDEQGNPIRPANGATGRKIDKLLCNCINNTSSKTNVSFSGYYDVYVVNAVQKQCSLGIKPINRLIVETNFVHEWVGPKQDLLNRISNIIQHSNSPDTVIVNCCTKGNYVPLQELVMVELRKLKKVILLEGPHPYSWKANTFFH